MDIQLGLISTVIRGSDMDKVAKARITRDHFWDEQYQRVFDFLNDHWSQYGTTPDEAILTRAFPSFIIEDQDQPLDYFIDGMHQHMRVSLLTEALYEAGDALSDEEDSEASRFNRIEEITAGVAPRLQPGDGGPHRYRCTEVHLSLREDPQGAP